MESVKINLRTVFQVQNERVRECGSVGGRCDGPGSPDIAWSHRSLANLLTGESPVV